MKSISLIGTGPGAEGFLTLEGKRAIDEAELLIGAKSVLERFAAVKDWDSKWEGKDLDTGKVCFASNNASDTEAKIRSCEAGSVAVLFSGDSGFYSGCRSLYPLIEDLKPRILPGVSSMAMLSAKSGIPWEDAVIVSLHGRKDNLVNTVTKHRKVFVLCSHDMKEWLRALVHAGLGECTVIAGEELSLPGERIVRGTAEHFSHTGLKPLSVCFILNERPAHLPFPGIPDELFARGSTPMTKREVRALAVSRLAICDGEVIYDIGAGTGSVTVELALSTPHGRVYAIERSDEGIGLIKRNEDIFGLNNVTVVHGEAPAAYAGLPAPDVAFIGGSGGSLDGIVRALTALNDKVRIAITAITVETAAAGIALLEEHHMDCEMVQISVSVAKKAGSSHMMIAQNPVWLITGRRL